MCSRQTLEHRLDDIAVSAVESKRALFSFLHKRNKSHLVDFTKQLATLLNSGIKLTEALSVLMMQSADPRFRNALTEIRDRVVTGESLTDALTDYDRYFDVIYVAMVRVGEVTEGDRLEVLVDRAHLDELTHVRFIPEELRDRGTHRHTGELARGMRVAAA